MNAYNEALTNKLTDVLRVKKKNSTSQLGAEDTHASQSTGLDQQEVEGVTDE